METAGRPCAPDIFFWRAVVESSLVCALQVAGRQKKIVEFPMGPRVGCFPGLGTTTAVICAGKPRYHMYSEYSEQERACEIGKRQGRPAWSICGRHLRSL